MKKLITVLMAMSILFAHGCSAEPEKKAEEPSTTQVIQAVKENKEANTNDYKQAYYELLDPENGRFGSCEEKDTEYGKLYIGTLFADLFDWDGNDVPELLVGYSNEDNLTYNIDYLDVYTVENGEAKQILSTPVYASYGALDGLQEIEFSRNNDGTLYLSVFNEETEEMTAMGKTVFTFDGEKAESTRLAYDVDFDWEGERESVYYNFRVDGKEVTEEEFRNKEKEFGEEDALYVLVDKHDMGALTDFLAGKTESYTTVLETSSEECPAWVIEADFGYKKTFTA